MKKLSILGVLFLTVVFLDSCSIVKRRYSPGYTVFWHTKSKAKKSNGHNEMSINKERISINERKSIKNNVEVNSTISLKKSEMESGNAYALYNSTTENDLASADINNRITVANTVNEKKNSKLGTQSTSNSKSTNSSSTNKDKIRKKSEFKNLVKSNSSSSDDDTVLYVILSFFLPPLAVYLFEGSWTSRCTTNLILTLLCGIPGVIHALIVILGGK
jgi:uncharacterized membrane protein YqaE (UPF0057 family)